MALTPGADNVNFDGDHAVDVLVTPILSSLTLLTTGVHRRINVDPSSAEVNIALPDRASNLGVSYYIRHNESTANDVNVVPAGSDEINGSTATVNLPEIGDWIEITAGADDWIILSERRTISPIVEIFTKTDLPDPVAGVIILDATKIYFINQIISLGTDRINLNGAFLRGVSPSKSGFIYTGTGALLTCTNLSVSIENILLQAVNGTLFDCSDDGTHAFSLNVVASSTCDKVGLVDNYRFFIAIRSQFSNATTSGFVFTGTAQIIAFRNSLIENNAGIFLDFSGMTAVEVVNLSFVDCDIPAGGTAVKNVAGSTNVTEIFRMENCDFRGLGTYVDTFNRCDPTVVFQHNFGNGGTEDSAAKGTSYIADGDDALTAISDLTSEVLIAGTYTLSGDECKMDDSSGLLTHTGDDTMTFNIGYKMLLEPASGNNREYWTYLRKNGTELILASRDSVTCSAATPNKAVGIGEVRMVQGDYVELIIIAKSNIVDVTATALTLLLST